MKRKNLRLKSYNYKSDGYYFVTIVTREYLPILKEFKEEIEKCVNDLPKFISGLSIDYVVVVDNHIHIIFVFDNCSRALGRVVAAMKSAITKLVAANVNSQYVDLHQPLQIWEWNYYEHVIRNEKALYAIRKYIQENKEKERLCLESVYRGINATATNS